MKTRLLPAGLIAAALLAGPAFAATPSAAPASQPVATHAAPMAMPMAKPAAVTATPVAMHTTAPRYAGLYRRAQEKLKDMNLYSGPVDGTRNAAFVRSVEGFQRHHHLHATGRLNPATRSALGIA